MKKIAQSAFVCLIAFIPLASIFELVSLFSGTVTSLVVSGAPIWWKLVKDALVLVVILSSALSQASGWRFNKMTWAGGFFITFFVLMSIVSSACLLPLPMIVAGLRWLLPVVLIFFLPAIMDKTLLSRVIRLLLLFFYIHVALQFIQLFTMSPFYGTQLGGLAARTPGMFLVPNTAAFYSTVLLCIFLFFEEKVRPLPVLLALASVLLTQSGTGIVVCAVLFFLSVLPRRFMAISPWAIAIGIGLLFAGFALVSPFLGRGADYLSVSGGTRLNIFLEAISNAEFWSPSFGYGTNSGMLLGVVDFATDSIYASVLINLGWGAFVGLCVALIAMLFKSKHDKRMLGLLVVYGLFGATTIFFEAFPMNYLFSLFFAAFFICPDKVVPGSTRRIQAIPSLPQ